MSVSSTSNALSYIQTLLQSMSSGIGGAASADPLDNLSQLFSGSPADGSTSQTSTTANAFGPSPPPFSSGTMAALMALQGQGTNGAGGAQSLFSQLDTDGDGSISKSEFENALNQSGVDTSSADALFSKLDRNGDGSVSQSELSSSAHRGRGHGHGHHHTQADGSGGAQGGDQGLSALLNASGADGAKTQTTTNSDGSSTTTITYADGSTVSMTTPAAEQNDGTSGGGGNGQSAGGSGSNNMLEQLIKLQAQFVSQQGASISAVA
jgi:hypothetical protein